MPLDPHPPAVLEFLTQVAQLYEAMRPFAHGLEPASEPDLGGQLLYAGELDAPGRALLVAGNIAGVASLAATADPAAQRQAVRDGVADFLVTSLDEALRILKNEIRKRQPVAVCVALAPEAIEREMLERGVQPDLLPPGAMQSSFLNQGARPLQLATLESGTVLLTWSVAEAPAQWLPRLDAIALHCLRPEDEWPRRWLRLAPRYLGRMAHGQRLMFCDREFAARFSEKVKDSSARGELAIAVDIQIIGLALNAIE